MARTITFDRRREVTRRIAVTGTEASVLRRYSVDLRLVDQVDNQDAPCEYCQEEAYLVTCNTYLVTFDREYLCVDHCRSCWGKVIDSEHDTDPEYKVITEMRQAA